MKKRVKLISVTAILLVLLIVTAVCMTNAATRKPAFSLTSATAGEGNEVQITLNLLNNPGITALSVQVAYSADDLELIAIDDAKLFEDKISTSKLTANPLTVSWYASDSGNKTNSGALAVLTFRVKEGAKSSSLTLSYDEDNVFDNNYVNVPFEVSPGAVTVRQIVTTEAPTDAPTEATHETKRLLIGDTDEDGIITILDATAIQRYLVALPTDARVGEVIEYE